MDPALDYDVLRVYVGALPPEDRQVFELMAGLEGNDPVSDRNEIKEALELKKGKTAGRIERAFRRLRAAAEIDADVEDDDIIESLIIGETRRRARLVIKIHTCQRAEEEAPVAEPKNGFQGLFCDQSPADVPADANEDDDLPL